jgi:cytochrome c
MMRLAIAGVLSASTLATSAHGADPAVEGKALLDMHCSRCHAIGADGDSPHRRAPPFRAVMKIYPAAALEEALGEGLVTGHPDMPEFVFPPGEVGAIISYLRSLEALP